MKKSINGRWKFWYNGILPVSLYDVSVYNGNDVVEMKDGKYTIKIKIDGKMADYENYQIIYVNDNGDIEEYIDGVVENGYIVFKTTHLSQYGVIADQVEMATVEINKSNKFCTNGIFWRFL